MLFSVLIAVIKVLLLSSASAGDDQTPCETVVSFEETKEPMGPKFLKTRGVINVVRPLPINITVKYEVPKYFTRKYEGDLRLANWDDLTKNASPGKPYSAKYYLLFDKSLPKPKVILVQVNDKILCRSDPISSGNKTTISRFLFIKWDYENPVAIHLRIETNNPKNSKNETKVESPGDTGDRFAFFQSHTHPVEYYNHNPFLHPREKDEGRAETFDYIRNFSTNHTGHYRNNPFLYTSGRPTELPRPRPTVQPTPRPKPRPTVQPTPRPKPRLTAKPHPTSATPRAPAVNVSSPPGSCKNTNWKNCCGTTKNFNHLIVNGVESRKGYFRWMVPLYMRTDPQYPDFKFICSSTLISDIYILTAAHCVSRRRKIEDESKFLAPVGMHKLENWYSPDVQTRGISRIYVHPDYDEFLDGDIALLKLSSRVVIGPAVVPACIWSEKEDLSHIVGRKSIAFGWGRDSKRQVTEVPNFVEMPIVSQEDCLNSNVNFHTTISNRTFCAGKKDGSGPCTGDSGGGLMLRGLKSDGTYRWYLRGVVSASLPSPVITPDSIPCDLKNYIIFSDVAKFKRWISFYINN